MKPLCTRRTSVLSFIILILLFMPGRATTSPSEPASGLSAELVKIETRPGVTLKFILIKPDNPVAAVVLLEGGPGRMRLSSSDLKPTKKRLLGFLARSREDFARHGFMVALLDAPSDRAVEGMRPIFRISNEHAQDIKTVVSYLKNKAKIPVWLVGMSLGSFSASNGAIRIKEGIDGVILTSSVTRSAERWAIYDSHPNGIVSMDLDKIKVPTLIVAHRDDKCPDTLASRTPEIKEALINSPRAEMTYFTGGKKPRPLPRSPAPPACQPLSPHGFYGIEEQVVPSIADFIKSNFR